MLKLKLLGGIAVELDHGSLEGRASQRHRLALLALLARSPGGAMRRDKVMSYLWPQSDAASARHLLNVSVHVLRQALQEDVLASTREELRLDLSRVQVDVLEFEAALTRRDLAAATSLYAGPFLDGFFLSHSREFEQWQDTERERLAREFRGALEAGASEAEGSGDLLAAVGWWRRLAAEDPFSSRIALSLMEALHRIGDVAGALQHAAIHGTLLREELDIDPGAAVIAFIERVREEHKAGPGEPPTATTGQGVLATAGAGGASPAAGAVSNENDSADRGGEPPTRVLPPAMVGARSSGSPAGTAEAPRRSTSAAGPTDPTADHGHTPAGARTDPNSATPGPVRAPASAHTNPGHGTPLPRRTAARRRDPTNPQPTRVGRPAGTRGRRIPFAAAWLNRSGWLAAAVAGSVLLAVVLLPGHPRQDASITAPRRVVVDVLENRTGDAALDVLGLMAADRLTEGLQRLENVEIIPPSIAMLLERRNRDTGIPSRGATWLPSLSDAAGADVVVSGAYYLLGNDIRVQVQIQDVRKGVLLYSSELLSAPRDRPDSAIEDAREQVTGYFAVDGSRFGSLGRPPRFEAYLEYSRGLDQLSAQQPAAAAAAFERAYDLDPGFAPALLSAASAYLQAGQYPSADASLARLAALDYPMPLADQAEIAYVEAALRGNLTGALLAARRRVELSPTPEVHFLHGTAALDANRPREGLAALLEIRHDLMPARWLPYEAQIARAHHLLGEFADELEAARLARRHHPTDLPLLTAELRALAALGRVNEVELGAGEFFMLAKDPTPALWAVAAELDAHGHSDASATVLQQLTAWHDSRPRLAARAPPMRSGKALTLAAAGRLREARQILEQLVTEYPDSLSYVGQLGAVAAQLGDTVLARHSLDALANTAIMYGHGRPQRLQAEILALLGERVRALMLLRDAVANGENFSDIELHANPNFAPLRGDPEFQELIRPKG